MVSIIDPSILDVLIDYSDAHLLHNREILMLSKDAYAICKNIPIDKKRNDMITLYSTVYNKV